MALSFSTGIRNFVGGQGSYKRALQGGRLLLYSGSAPSTADAAVSGTLLASVYNASGTWAAAVPALCTITIAGSSGTIDSITVNGIEILGAAVTYDTDLATTAAAVATQINSYVPQDGVEYYAWSVGAVVWIKTLPGHGTSCNGYQTTAAATTLTFSATSGFGTAGTGSASTKGLQYGAVTGNVLTNSGVWSGTVANGGVAGYFRLLGEMEDGGTASTTQIRIQGACGIATGDYPMTSTTLTAGKTHTVDEFTLTLPAA